MTGESPVLSAPYQREDLEALLARYGSPLVLIDCNVLRSRYQALTRALPGVELHYALKPMPEPCVVRTFAALGAGFDLATNGETALVRSAGVAPERCIHTHPIKRDSDIRDALRFGVRTFVVDNEDEIGKFVKHRTRAQLLLRISFRNPSAGADLSRKFGCTPADAPQLLSLAARLGIKVCGLSFHAGSQVANADAHVHAIDACAALIAQARQTAQHKLEVLDIGGGFPSFNDGSEGEKIYEFCAPIRAALDRLPEGVRVLAEPGRFLVAAAATCLTSVIGRAKREGRWWYYLDDGVYGTFSGQIFDHAQYPIDSLKSDGPRLPSTLTGPTCDSIDIVREDILLPELEAGDVLVARMVGAYTTSCATDFNFVPRARVIGVNV
jgi:ornithine decarboxylase